MNALVLDGCHERSGFDRLIAEALADRGADVRIAHLSRMKIAPCAGCFGCWVKTPGVCVIDDDARDLARSVARADVQVFLTPITFGGYSSLLKAALDRRICLLLPFFEQVEGTTRHVRRYRRATRLVAVGLLPAPDAEAEHLFAGLVRRNALNIRPAAYSSGAIAVTQGERAARLRIGALLDEAGAVHEPDGQSVGDHRQLASPEHV